MTDGRSVGSILPHTSDPTYPLTPHTFIYTQAKLLAAILVEDQAEAASASTSTPHEPPAIAKQQDDGGHGDGNEGEEEEDRSLAGCGPALLRLLLAALIAPRGVWMRRERDVMEGMGRVTQVFTGVMDALGFPLAGYQSRLNGSTYHHHHHKTKSKTDPRPRGRRRSRRRGRGTGPHAAAAAAAAPDAGGVAEPQPQPRRPAQQPTGGRRRIIQAATIEGGEGRRRPGGAGARGGRRDERCPCCNCPRCFRCGG